MICFINDKLILP